jgi:hypothetical protein
MSMRSAILVGALLLVPGCTSGHSTRITPEDKAEAVRLILAWLTGDGRIPGFDQDYPDPMKTKDGKPILLVCDFLPADVRLTDNPRFHRVSQAEYDKAVAEDHSDLFEQVRLRIEVRGDSDQELKLLVDNHVSAKGGHQYGFVFRKTSQGLTASGERWLCY